MSHRRWVAEARESFPARARAWKDVETSRACNESDRGHQPLPLIPKSCGAAADPNFLNRDEISTVSLKTLSKLIALALVTFPKIFRYQNQTIAVWIYLFGLTQNFGRLFLSDSSPIIVYLCPKYFHSLDSQNQITFNSSQIFETHPSTGRFKFPLAQAAVASIQLVPKYMTKVKVISKYLTLKQLLPSKMGKISLMQLSNEEIKTGGVAQKNDLPKSYFQLPLPQVHV